LIEQYCNYNHNEKKGSKSTKKQLGWWRYAIEYRENWNEVKGFDHTLYPFEYAPLISLKFIYTNVNLQGEKLPYNKQGQRKL